MRSIIWEKGKLKLIDQTRLPLHVEYIECCDFHAVAEAIKNMKVRGAPAIGAAAAYGMVLGALAFEGNEKGAFRAHMNRVAEVLKQTRPTAVNLFWAVNRMLRKIEELSGREVPEIKQRLLEEAHAIYQEDLEMNRRIGQLGNQVVPPKAGILTHCNAGALATAGYGTALGVVRAAHEAGKEIHVWADETRPLLQGARLTVWELMQDNIPVTLITDSMAGYVMRQKKIDLVIVGADRIAANGDVANKIGTYGLAVLAKEHGIPFYVAAPFSTVDLALDSGNEIPIEERDCEEVRCIYGQRVVPEEVEVYNPAFDVTPHHLITAIITDRGIARPPYRETLAQLAQYDQDDNSGRKEK
ncbi:S-methyl-5-thioribose-1-phosphate isomerase [Calderihabitans maritimus]|uniref:Methylthioribose-1-phosphate isomerase n=1 Tax=Calderihabitans maritimus TaxID=1246530 RepID=A0A1Z5HNE4_9FIRM|nr:S-methyl-5-thioribose-1-phosphate isomerase [Calderihabitans maritimus]GAW91043.1 S-methyl-5-thioribose-1-phosphate isomerase [Calderihabitans maritimus]